MKASLKILPCYFHFSIQAIKKRKYYLVILKVKNYFVILKVTISPRDTESVTEYPHGKEHEQGETTQQVSTLFLGIRNDIRQGYFSLLLNKLPYKGNFILHNGLKITS